MAPLVNVLVGSFYCILAAILFAINVVVLFVILRNTEYNTNTYRIIKHMIIGCLMQLCSHFLGGLMTLSNSNLNSYLERFAGAWIQSGWFLYLGSSLALAVDRSLTFVCTAGKRCSMVNSWGLLVFSWTMAAVYLICLLLPGYGFTYWSEHGYFDWFYDTQPNTRIFLTLELCLDFSILVFVLFLYFVVFARLITMRRSGSSSTGISSSVVELRILGIAVISFLYECTYLLWFFWGKHLIDDGIASSVIVSTLWIVDCGLFSVATLLINGSVRRKVADLVTRKPKTTVRSISLKSSRLTTILSVQHR